MDPSQQIADLLLAQWNLLWWAKPTDRKRIIEETRADYHYEATLESVRYALTEATYV